MRTLILSIVVCIGMGYFLGGCQKEDLGNLDAIFADTTQNGAVAAMTAKINGVAWSASSYNVTLQPTTPLQIVITGQSDDGQSVTLTVKSDKAGDYILTRATTSAIGAYSPDTISNSSYLSNALLATGGIINIDQIDTTKFTMTGEFNFIGGRSDGTTKTITDGIFTALDYTNVAQNTNFTAKYNGSLWNPKTVTANINGSNLAIVASNANGSVINLTIPLNLPARKLPYEYSSGKWTASYLEGGYTLIPDEASTYNTKPYATTKCELVISTNNIITRNIQGNFTLYVVNKDNLAQKGSRITGGVFNIKY